MCVPDNVVTNDDLARIMETSDDWIASRTGVRQRRFADPGVGGSDLGAEAAMLAIAYAGIAPSAVDILVTATMTPDHLAPGIAAVGFATFGAGAHYGAALYRVPADL